MSDKTKKQRNGFIDNSVKPKAAAACIFFTVLAAAVFLPLIPVNAGSVYVETGAGYKTGDFGSTVETRLVSVFTKVGYFTEHYELNISAPYLFLRNETDAGHDMQSGFGDAVLRAGASLIGQTPNGYSLYGSASVKLPTADPNKGLGTGEADYGAFLTGSKRFDNVSLWVSGGGIMTGDTPQQALNDLYYYEAGISRAFDRTIIYLSASGYREIVPEADAPISANIGFFHILSPRYSVRGALQAGLSRGAPDYGISFSLILK